MEQIVKEWLSTQWRAACAPERIGNGRDYRPVVTGKIYPRLWQAGYPLPLNIVLDLSYLFLSGQTHRLEGKAKTENGQEITGYRQAINEEVAKGPLRRAIREARRNLVSKRRSSPSSSAGETDEMMAGLPTFLELVAAELFRERAVLDFFDSQDMSKSDRGFIPAQVWNALLAGPIEFSGPEGKVNQQALGFMQGFWNSLLGASGREPEPLFGRVFSEEAYMLLAAAGVRASAGTEALDLPVLQACLNYQPLGLNDERRNRYERLRRTLSMRDSRSSRAPEFGNFGVTTKPNPTAILRSHLARENFVYYYYLKQALYFQRYRPQQEPHQALLAWLIDRGELMQRRVATPHGERRDALARQIAAYLIEDAVRYLRSLPAIELCAVVLFHNGESDPKKYRGLPIHIDQSALAEAPPVELKSKVAPATAQSNGHKPGGRPDVESPIWLPKVKSFLPEYFLREPWQEASRLPFNRKAGGDEPPAGPNPAGRYVQAFRQLADVAHILRREMTAADAAHSFDLCHLSVFGPDERLPVKEMVAALRSFYSWSALTGLSVFAFGNSSITYGAWPEPRSKLFARDGGTTGESKPIKFRDGSLAQSVASYDKGGIDWNRDILFGARQWDYLMELLEAI